MIPLAAPNLTGKEAEYLGEALANNYIGPGGPFVERFEDMVAEASGRKWAVAVLTGSEAIFVTAMVVSTLRDFRPGDKFETPFNAYPAVRNMMKMVGAKPVDKGQDENDGKDHDRLFFGLRELGWPVACDCAPAIGEPPTRSLADLYSFAANKTVTCGQGGAICGDDPQLETAIRLMIRQGHGRPGLANKRMPDLAAAVGCAQMERLGEFREKKRAIWRRYKDAGIPMVERGMSRWMSTAELRHFSRAVQDPIEPEFAGEQIEIRREPWGDYSLPCSTALTIADQEKVIRVAERFT